MVDGLIAAERTDKDHVRFVLTAAGRKTAQDEQWTKLSPVDPERRKHLLGYSIWAIPVGRFAVTAANVRHMDGNALVDVSVDVIPNARGVRLKLKGDKGLIISRMLLHRLRYGDYNQSCHDEVRTTFARTWRSTIPFELSSTGDWAARVRPFPENDAICGDEAPALS
jgi:hypothetical protein